MLIFIKWLLLTGILGGIHYKTSAQEVAIPENYLWKNRLILLFASDKDNPMLQQQHTQLQADADGLTDRDLLIFRVLPGQVIGQDTIWDAASAQKLRDKYDVKKSEFCVILIGKDGSEKLRKDELLARKELYAVIDAMPMRRREMREDQSEN